MKPAKEFLTLATVSDYAQLCGVPAPTHPLLLLIDLEQTRSNALPKFPLPVVQQLYTVGVRKT